MANVTFDFVISRDA